jgi:NAD(P)-dependent dehydrogenase (short-subunit alcohol dehydrogenase family)
VWQHIFIIYKFYNMQKSNSLKPLRPEQTIRKKQGQEMAMQPQPQSFRKKTDRKLEGKVAIVTGGDSGIGRAVAIAFAQEGAKVSIIYKADDIEAEETQRIIEQEDGSCFLLKLDITSKKNCIRIIDETVAHFGKLDILVNNAGVQFPETKLSDITEEHLRLTFDTNFFAQFYLIQAAEKQLEDDGSIINTTSVTAYRGSKGLVDYSATKGAIVSMTRSLSAYFADRGIRVNAVAPGPIWTPLIPTTFPREKVASFGSDVPLKRAGEPAEVAPCYVFLASDDSSYMTGQVLHPNGGEIVNG